MEIQILDTALQWTELGTLPMHELCHDWHGESVDPPAYYALVEDPAHLWLIATRERPAKSHPMGDCGDFQAELWHYDVAELFIAAADGSGYLEFNLSPAGAWWMERFSEPRLVEGVRQRPEVRSHAGSAGGGWIAALGVPLDWLHDAIGWGADSPLNVSFILDSPGQRFLSACDLGGGEPDFHRPDAFEAALRQGG